MEHMQVADVCRMASWQGLALAHNAAGDLPAARAAFRKAVKLEPEHAPSWQACACWVPTLGGYPVKLLSWGSLPRCASHCAGAGARLVGAGMAVLVSAGNKHHGGLLLRCCCACCESNKAGEEVTKFRRQESGSKHRGLFCLRSNS